MANAVSYQCDPSSWRLDPIFDKNIVLSILWSQNNADPFYEFLFFIVLIRWVSFKGVICFSLTNFLLSQCGKLALLHCGCIGSIRINGVSLQHLNLFSSAKMSWVELFVWSKLIRICTWSQLQIVNTSTSTSTSKSSNTPKSGPQ